MQKALISLSHFSVVFALLACACTFTSQENVIKGDFHPPLVSPAWNTQKYDAPDGTVKLCMVSSGANGLSVSLTRQQGATHFLVKSNHPMMPGVSLTVSAGGRLFQTGEAVFSPDESQALVDVFSLGGKAYLEWSEIHGANDSRVNVQNILRLDDFNGRLSECKNALGQ